MVNNLIHDAGAYAIQTQGISNARFINNRVWNSHFGGLLVRTYRDLDPRGTVVANNLLYGVGGLHMVDAFRNNVVRGDKELPPRNIVISPGADPGFVDLRGRDFSLVPWAIAKAAGSADYAPERDFAGRARSISQPSAGAFE